MELSETAGSRPRDVLISALNQRSMLLLLDNMEQVLDCAVQVADLLAACPSLRILATSRATLRITGEREIRLEPLPTADPNDLPALELLALTPAVQLFWERARDVRVGFALSAQSAEAVASICSRLEGLPLALELAAARLKLFDPAVLLTKLDRALDLLTAGQRDAPARQQRLRDTIAWSYDLLSPPDGALFRRLAVFTGSFTLDAAATVTGDRAIESSPDGPSGEACALDGIASLVDQSLLWRDDSDAGEARFRLCATVREYAWELLEASGELPRLQSRHASYYLNLAEQADHFAATGERRRWHDRLELDHDNLRSAQSWCASAGDAESDLRLTASMLWFYDWRGHINEGRARFEAALDRHRERCDSEGQSKSLGTLVARTLCGAGAMAWLQGEPDAAQSRLEQGFSLAESLGDARVMALAADFLGLVAQYQGDQSAAQGWYKRTIDLARESGDTWRLADGLTLLGDTLPAERAAEAEQYYLQSLALYREAQDPWAALPLTSMGRLALQGGDYAKARTLLDEAVALRRSDGIPLLIGIALAASGEAARCAGDLDRAEDLFRESLELSRSGGFRHNIAWALCGLGCIAARRGEQGVATALLDEALPLANELGQRPRVAACLVGQAGAALLEGEYQRAVELLDAANALCQELRTPLEPADQIDYERYLAAART